MRVHDPHGSDRSVNRSLPRALLIAGILALVGMACDPDENPMSPAPPPAPESESLHVRCDENCGHREPVNIVIGVTPRAPGPPDEDPCSALLRVIPHLPIPEPGPTVEIECDPPDAVGRRGGALPVAVWLPVSRDEPTVHVRWAVDERISPSQPFVEMPWHPQPPDPGGWGCVCLELFVAQDRTLAPHILNLEVRDSAPSPDEPRVDAIRATLHRSVPFAVIDAASPLWREGQGLTRYEGGGH